MAINESTPNVCEQTPVVHDASLLLPAYNEWQRADVFKSAIDNYQTFLGDRIPGFELAVFADGCERSAEIAETMGATVMRHVDGENHGRGEALRQGLTRLHSLSGLNPAGVYGYTDADGSYSPEHIMDLFEAINSGYDLAVTHRLDNSDSSLPRRLAHIGMHKVCELIAPTGIKDPQAGAKAFSARFIDEVVPQTVTDRWAFDRELAVITMRDGLPTIDLGAEITTHENSTVRPIHDALEMIKDSRKIRQTHLS